MRSVVLPLVVLLAAANCFGAVAVDFEDWAGGDGDQTTANSRGYSFATSNGAFFIFGPGDQYLTSRSGSLKMTKVGSGTFSLSSLDLREGIGDVTQYVNLTGIHVGVVAKKTYTLDGNGTTWDHFPIIGFDNIDILLIEPYSLAANFGTSFSLDNVNVIPEPALIRLLSVGLVFVRRSRSYSPKQSSRALASISGRRGA